MNWIRSAAPSSGEGGGALHDGEEVSQVKSSQVKSSQVEQASGRWECALFMGATGRLDKSSCEWQGLTHCPGLTPLRSAFKALIDPCIVCGT